MSKIFYAVMETNYQYDDNYYYVGENDVGRVTKLYKTKEKARAALAQMVRKFFLDQKLELCNLGRNGDIFSQNPNKYFNGTPDEQKTARVLEDEFDVESQLQNYDEDIFLKKFRKMSDEDFLGLIGCMNSPPFSIQEVEVEG
jgi:hypothetical protein